MVSPSGFLLFPRQTTLFAQAFDFKRQELSGNPFPVAEQAAFDLITSAPGFSATSGIVAYRTVVARQLTWLDRSGKSVGAIGAPDTSGLTHVELSPDGKRVAVDRTFNGNQDVWLIDAMRGCTHAVHFRYRDRSPARLVARWEPRRVHVQSKRRQQPVLETIERHWSR